MTTPYDTPIPGAAGYGQAALLAKTAYQNTLARINRNRSSAIRSAGYLGDVDQTTGVMKNLRVDPHNPYGQFQQMLRGQAQEGQQAQFANEERGLHGGLAHKADSELHYQHGMQSSQFGTNLADSFTDLQDQQTQAAYERDRALYEAEQEAARNAVSSGDFNPAGYGDGSGGGGSSDSGGGGSTYATTPAQAAQNLVKNSLSYSGVYSPNDNTDNLAGLTPEMHDAILKSAMQSPKQKPRKSKKGVR